MIINGISVAVQRKNIKNMYLRVVPPEGDVKISAPLFVSDDKIIEFVESKMDWILAKKTQISEKKYLPQLKYVNGEKHYLWGEEFTLQLIANNIKTAFVKEDILYLPVSKRSKMKARQKTLEDFYREELQKEILEIYDKCTAIVGKKPSEIKIRKMKNWGNCKQNKVITLNLNLAKKPKICTQYVLIHELCHLIEFNHSKKFKMLMDKNCPNWREIKKMLND
ncbi:MAG: M48 family metallopeptidase [Methanobrevibacter millerae]|uniref:M48 family metallopeptidase n=1 Tax=Methanobrevibacter millerae TaxID=230361 RepID=A0A8T3VE57_9EURY|nr:SprT family zinc-dependent metalloprotease [Methanobrevibacter millerae]MBE6504705.1 M48 family metallopeptidase [Methanobrevibacter millerae]